MIRKRNRADIKMSADYEGGINEIHPTETVACHGVKKKPYQILLPSSKPKQQLSVQLSNAPKIKHSTKSVSKQQIGRSTARTASEFGLKDSDCKFIERFNRDMMDQFMEHQRRSQVKFTKNNLVEKYKFMRYLFKCKYKYK